MTMKIVLLYDFHNNNVQMSKSENWLNMFLSWIWVRSRRCGCLVTWFCYQLIAKLGNKTAAPSWPDPYTKMNPGYFLPCGHSPETATNPHVSKYFCKSSRAAVTYIHIRIIRFYVKTAKIHQLKCLCVPDCTYLESMFINFIHIIQYSISSMQTILYKLKRDAAVWKRRGCTNIYSEPGGK